MKTTRETLLERRSIRRYEREPLTTEQLNFIYDAIRNTPTSYNGQQFSVIDITDQEVKEQLYNLTGQKQIKTCNHFMVFCADLHKITLPAKAKNINVPAFHDTLDGYTVAVVDASLAMMSAVAAACSLGLGTCCIGYARTVAPEQISQILKLPKQVAVICGLAIGVPREMPDIKPKQPIEAIIHKNAYTSDDKLQKLLLDYDTEITTYNQTRSGSKSTNNWVGHILSYYAEAMDYHMLEAMRNQGFNPKQ